ncbi:MAG TPA: sigma-70 family RNA polymerase sigma factor [Myxococcales bacterium]|nr:sigma-70 family RNA polymerase sigma factor [Myxococcales bacterium]
MKTNFVGWISTLARTHTRPLAAVAVREGLARFEAVDAVQEAFSTLLALPQARELSLDDEGAARLMAVLVRNAARNMRRRRQRARSHEPLEGAAEVAGDTPGVDALIAAAEEHVALLGCVNQLAELQRHVLTMRVLDELTPEDVAGTLKLTTGHVAVLLHRARRRLLECLERGRAEAG